ncbi:GAF domain-containing protein [Cystobacter ferrugineus]|uniref:GAF domain-containing protein n=1 Tax=Cystobacter ferrugineus TaxID=83449 RepID=A0A1L9BKK4_9BACT|nr:GAF domain-containing protein [Cystobacter ferrugineus]OJH42688.1 hypothetical protein BON30_05775 [Cystobacter ferrugineus]
MHALHAELLETLVKPPHSHPEQLLNEVVRRVGEGVHADRCFLWVRQPATRRSRGAVVWRRDESVPDLTPEQREWIDETLFPPEDPLYAAALAHWPSVYVNDVRTAPREVLNRDFEDRYFGHRALIHAHIVGEGELWGILQPCVFGQPREWTPEDRALIEPLLPRLVPVVKTFLAAG